jgi:hypothetical protein
LHTSPRSTWQVRNVTVREWRKEALLRKASETTAHVAGFGFSNEVASAPSLLPRECYLKRNVFYKALR